MWRRFRIGAGVTALVALAHLPAAAQEQPASSNLPGGLHLANATVFSSYYSALPLITGVTGYDVTTGGSATVTGTRRRPRSAIYFSYTISYLRDITYSLSNSLDHNFSFSASRSLAPGWRFSGAVSASVMNTSEFLFQPNIFGQATSVAASPDDLAAAILSGTNYDNAQLASLLTGAPLLESPARSVFFGDRILNAAALTTLTRTKQRLTLTFNAGGIRIQNLPTQAPAGVTTFLLPAATSELGGMTLAYSLSPRTQVGFSVSTERTFSREQDAYASTATAHIGRHMGPRWSVELHGGTGWFKPVRSTIPLPAGPQYLAGASLAFKTASHSFLLSADRNIQNAYGFGASSNFSTTAGWNWRRPGRSWTLFANASQQQLQSVGLSAINAWLVSGGFSQTLTRKTAMNITYAYMRNSSGFAGLPAVQDTHAVRLTLVCTP